MSGSYQKKVLSAIEMVEEAQKDAADLLSEYEEKLGHDYLWYNEKVSLTGDKSVPLRDIIRLIFPNFQIRNVDIDLFRRTSDEQRFFFDFEIEIPSRTFKEFIANEHYCFLEAKGCTEARQNMLLAKQIAILYWKEKKRKEYDGHSEVVYMNLFALSLVFPEKKITELTQIYIEYNCERMVNQEEILAYIADFMAMPYSSALQAYHYGIIKI